MLFRSRRRSRGGARTLLFASLAVALLALGVIAARKLLCLAWVNAWGLAGRSAPADELRSIWISTVSDPALTWFGPTTAILVVVGVVLVRRADDVRQPLRTTLALAPLAFLPVLAFSVPWDPWRGRFFVFPVALATAAWALLHRSRALAWATAAVVAVTMVAVLADNRMQIGRAHV